MTMEECRTPPIAYRSPEGTDANQCSALDSPAEDIVYHAAKMGICFPVRQRSITATPRRPKDLLVLQHRTAFPPPDHFRRSLQVVLHLTSTLLGRVLDLAPFFAWGATLPSDKSNTLPRQSHQTNRSVIGQLYEHHRSPMRFPTQSPLLNPGWRGPRMPIYASGPTAQKLGMCSSQES